VTAERAVSPEPTTRSMPRPTPITATTPGPSARRRSPAATLGVGLTYLACIVVAAVAISPFVWMLSSSFKDESEIISLTPRLIPDPWTFDNYRYLVDNGVLPFVRFFANSGYITVVVIVGRLLVCALAAYGFARLEFRGRDAAFGLLLASLMIPDMLMVLPLYSAYVRLGLIDTHFPLLVPPVVANTFGTFLLRQFFLSIPKEYDEAALVDGASHFRIFVSVILPLSKPALATLAVLTFVNVWNDFFGPLIYLNDIDKFTIPVGLAFFQTQDGTEYGPLMAGATLAILPTIAIFVFAQKYFTRGITMSGLK
jgi:multiple sugar transport system permease protein